MRVNVAYSKECDEYEIEDDYGGSNLDIPTVKKLLKLIKRTHPELLEDL